MIVTLIRVVIFLLWLILAYMMMWKCPRYVYVVKRRCWFSNTDTIVAVYRKRNDAKNHIRQMVIDSVNHLSWGDLLFLCHEIGIDGLGKQPIEILRELVITEVNNPGDKHILDHIKYNTIKDRFKIYSPEAIRLR